MEPPCLGGVLAVGREMWFFLMRRGRGRCETCVGLWPSLPVWGVWEQGLNSPPTAPLCLTLCTAPVCSPPQLLSSPSGLVPPLIPVGIHQL